MTLEDSRIVSIVRCKRYHPDTVMTSLRKLLDPWGGINTFVKPGQRVLLKPNLLAAARPEEAVTTHPAIMKALTLMIQDAGGLVYIGDSPGRDDPDLTYRITGMQEVAEETGARLIKFDRFIEKDYDGIRRRKLELASALDQVDLVINVAKLKSHPLTGLTGAVKNIFGCIVGNKKAKMHFEYPQPGDFSRLLIDVFMAVRPVFSIIDAVIAMEGTGPRSGRPRNAGLIMASTNGFALDSAAAAIVGFKDEQVTTLVAAKEESIPGADIAELETRGLDLEDSLIDDFDPGATTSGRLSRLATRYPLGWIKNLINRRRAFPGVEHDLCTGCGVCSEECPAQVICLKGGIPDIEPEHCIRCYCCMEFCPHGAIKLR